MDSSVKRIGDVTIERVISDKKDASLREDRTMNSESDSDSESLSSDDELLLTHESQSIELGDKSTVPNIPQAPSLTSTKRKNDFDSENTQAKKVKNQFDQNSGESDSDLNTVSSEINPSGEINAVTEANVDQALINVSLHSENEDSEYDSDDESDLDDSAPKLDARVPILDSDKSDFIEKLASSLGETSSQKDDDKIDSSDYDYDITEKLKEMGEISVETVKKGEKPKKTENADLSENEISVTPARRDSDSDSEDKNSSERKIGNMRRNIREVMDETQLDEATLAAQRQEMERLRRVQEQQRIIREVQRQIALNRQNNKTQHRVISLLQGNNSIIKQMPGTSGATTNRVGNTVLVKLPNGETKSMTRITKSQTPFEVVRLQKGAIQGKVGKSFVPVKKNAGSNLTPSVSIAPVAKKVEPKAGSDSETETSDSEKKIRKIAGKPKDVVTISSSSDDDCIVLSEDEAEEPEPEEDPCNSGMHTNDAYNVPDEQGRVLINVGHPDNEADIFLAPQIARVIKPHQIGGVRFLYDNVIETTDRFSTSTGFGCILAHSMGLGKTLQVVCFSDIFLRHTPAKTILCIMPINTLQNWMAEFNMWLPRDTANSPLLSHGEVRPRNFNLFVLNDSHKTLAARAKVIQEWHKDGGVLLIGYELYRLLSLRRNPKSKSKRNKKANSTTDPETPEDEEKNKSLFEEIHEALVKPGPDLVICDEGHRIKNSHASISQALKLIRSKRRIVLTGYPLQNNLLEYWCMVDFVRPNYLGTKTEFSNMFERPIQNGQCIDSTPQDIRLMRYRAHVLHSLLEGFVQRRSHAVLQTSLPQKEEYVLLVRMTDFQRKLYDTFMNEVVRTKTVPNPLKAFAVCCKIWNHPDVLYYFLKKHTSGEAVDIDLEEVAGAAAGAAATPTTPKKGSSRARGGSKKEKKTAASKLSTNSSKPAASVTPNTNVTTSPSSTATSSSSTPMPPAIPAPMNMPNANIPSTGNAGLPNTQNYHQPNQNYPLSPYPNPHLPYGHQNYPNYSNGDYYNHNYPNYNQHYYPSQEYGGFYENPKPENYTNGYPTENQNYWNASGQNQYYNQTNQEYYNNMTPSYDNQNYYQGQSYGQNVYPGPNYGSSWPQAPAPADSYKPDPDFKPTFKSEFGNAEFKQEFKTDEKPEKLKLEEAIDIDEVKPKCETAADDDKKLDATTLETKEEGDEKGEKDNELKCADAGATLPKINVKEDPGIPYDWATELMKGYVPGCIENSAKMEIFICILQESMALGDRILLFSQSLFTLNLIEDFLQKYDVPGNNDKWTKNKHYYRLDGSTSALEREKLINEYNSNPNIHLFLVSTRAGSLGINLVGANRVIVFDASWNPCHDTQAVCRVYRYGQKKPCFVYRIVMDNCLEKKIYDRQINKQGMADRVVDECNPDAHLSMKDVTNLCWDDEKDSEVKDFSTTKDKYIDVVMQKVLDAFSHRLSKEPFQHESLLIDRKEKKLSQAEKRLAKRSYELEKQANINSRPTYNYYNNGTGQGLQIRAIRTQDGVLQNKPVASVRPMQSEHMVRDLNRQGGAAPGRSRWIPAEVWQRQGMTAQEMTLPLDVVIPTNSPDRGSIVLKAGQKVLVLKSPKGIYMQLECGKIVAIKTAFKVRGGKAPEKGAEEANNKEPSPNTILKKVPQAANTSKVPPANVPLPLKNNSAITVIPKAGQQRVVKPFTQSVTKLNMRSIRQPVPNLVGRQMSMRVNNPRFTGKIQSVHRKVQLAKAKPYNLDKLGDSPTKVMDAATIKMEPPDLDGEPHVVHSSDEDVPMDEQPDKKDASPDSDRYGNNDMYSSSEKSLEASSDVERMSSNDYGDGEGALRRRPSTDSGDKDSHSNIDYPSLDYPPTLDKCPPLEAYHASRFQQAGADSYQGPPSLEKFGGTPPKYPEYSGPQPPAPTPHPYQPMDTFVNVEYGKSDKYTRLDKAKRAGKDEKGAAGVGPAPAPAPQTPVASPFSPGSSQSSAVAQLQASAAQGSPPLDHNQFGAISNQFGAGPSQNAPGSNQFMPPTSTQLALGANQQTSPVQSLATTSNQNVSAPNPNVLGSNQIAPASNQNYPGSNQSFPASNQVTPASNQSAPVPGQIQSNQGQFPTAPPFQSNSNQNQHTAAPTNQIHSNPNQPQPNVGQLHAANSNQVQQPAGNQSHAPLNQLGAHSHAISNQMQAHAANAPHLTIPAPQPHPKEVDKVKPPSTYANQNISLGTSYTSAGYPASGSYQNPNPQPPVSTSNGAVPTTHQHQSMHPSFNQPGPNNNPHQNMHNAQPTLLHGGANSHQNQPTPTLHIPTPNLHQNQSRAGVSNMHPNTSNNMHQSQSNLHPGAGNPHQNVRSGAVAHPPPAALLHHAPSIPPNAQNVHQSNANVHQPSGSHHQSNPTMMHQNIAAGHQTSPNMSQTTSSLRQMNAPPSSTHPISSPNQNLHAYHQTNPVVSQAPNHGVNLHQTPPNLHQTGSNLHQTGSNLHQSGPNHPALHNAGVNMPATSTNLHQPNAHLLKPELGAAHAQGTAPHGAQLHGGHHHVPNTHVQGTPPAPATAANLHQLGSLHQNLQHAIGTNSMHTSPPNVHQMAANPSPASTNVPNLTPTAPSPGQGASAPPLPTQSATNPPIEQGNTNRSLKNYRHNFASQKGHGNFGTAKPHKNATSSSALHHLEQATSAIGENKQPFQESLDSITNSYGAMNPGDPNKPEETHIIDLDSDKHDEIVENATKPPSLKTTQATPGEKQPAAQPAAAPSTKPDGGQQSLSQPQDYGGYSGYYGYNSHLQGYPQAQAQAQPQPQPQPQPLAPPQNYYAPPEIQHYTEHKHKTDKSPSSTATSASTANRSEIEAPVSEAVPSHHTSYTSTSAGFGHYGQPGLPPPPSPHPHGAYDMMYPQQNQYPATYPGVSYATQPYAPYQATYETAAPQANMYSAFHRPELHAYPDPYGPAGPYMRAGYPLPAPPPATTPAAPPPPPPTAAPPPPAHPHVGQYAPYGAQYPPPPPPPPPGYEYQYAPHPAAPPFVSGLN